MVYRKREVPATNRIRVPQDPGNSFPALIVEVASAVPEGTTMDVTC
jgi:hypothetical protein